MDNADFSKLINEYHTSRDMSQKQEFGKQLNNKQYNSRSNQQPHNNTQNRGHGAHTCQTCNYSFKTRQMLFDHLSTHIQCDEDYCDFVGVSQAVAKHKREEHEQPESAQLFAMEHPAVLEAWLQQRRKNFPSSGNVKLKKLREEAKIDFGIVARDKSFTLKGNQWAVKRHKPCIPADIKPAPFTEVVDNDPLSFILKSDPNEKVASSPLLLGMGAYNSSSDSDTEKEPTINSIKSLDESKSKSAPNVEQMLNKFKRYAKMRGAEGNQKRKRMKWNGVMKSGRRRYQPTLLQRLLVKDITEEHNKMLQCIRYIVSNNFFDVPLSHATEESGSRTAKEPLSHITEESGSQTAEEPLSHITEESGSRTVEEPLSHITEESGSRTDEEPLSHITEESGSQTAEEPLSHATEESGSRSAEEPLSHITEESGSRTVEEPPSHATEESGSRTDEEPLSHITEESGSRTDEEPLSHITEESGSRSAEKNMNFGDKGELFHCEFP